MIASAWECQRLAGMFQENSPKLPARRQRSQALTGYDVHQLFRHHDYFLNGLAVHKLLYLFGC